MYVCMYVCIKVTQHKLDLGNSANMLETTKSTSRKVYLD